MEISPENDKIFGFDTVRKHGSAKLTVRPNSYDEDLVIRGHDSNGQYFYFSLGLDDAEEVAYRILYAVTKLREENQ